MWEVYLPLPELEVDLVTAKKTVNKLMGRTIREATRRWLRAVLLAVPARGGFPVLHGEAKGSLQPLGEFLRVAVPVRPVKLPYRTGIGRGSGLHFDIKDDDPITYVYHFKWRTEVLHYQINEFYHTIPHSPWLTTVAGEAAFFKYLEEAWEQASKQILVPLLKVKRRG